MPQHSVQPSVLFSQAPATFAPRFHIEIYAPPHRAIVRAHGEIDMATGNMFRAALIAALDQQPRTLTVDLDGVSFLDACGLGILVGVANLAARTRIPIMVVSARPHVYRLFDLTHLVDRLDVHARPSAPAAPAPLPTRPLRRQGLLRPPVPAWGRRPP